MTDIVERLRQTVEAFDNGYPPPAMMTADETAELLAEIKRCYGAIADLQAEVRKKSDENEDLKAVITKYLPEGSYWIEQR